MAKDKLTLKQETFLLAYLESGKSADAYRKAYDTTNMSDQAASVEASKLLKHPVIALKIQEATLRREKQSDTKALLSLEEHMEELRLIREMAKTKGQFASAVAAEVKRGELRKFYVKQIETGEAGDFKKAEDDVLDDFIATEAAALGIKAAPPKSARH